MFERFYLHKSISCTRGPVIDLEILIAQQMRSLQLYVETMYWFWQFFALGSRADTSIGENVEDEEDDGRNLDIISRSALKLYVALGVRGRLSAAFVSFSNAKNLSNAAVKAEQTARTTSTRNLIDLRLRKMYKNTKNISNLFYNLQDICKREKGISIIISLICSKKSWNSITNSFDAGYFVSRYGTILLTNVVHVNFFIRSATPIALYFTV